MIYALIYYRRQLDFRSLRRFQKTIRAHTEGDARKRTSIEICFTFTPRYSPSIVHFIYIRIVSSFQNSQLHSHVVPPHSNAWKNTYFREHNLYSYVSMSSFRFQKDRRSPIFHWKTVASKCLNVQAFPFHILNSSTPPHSNRFNLLKHLQGKIGKYTT